MRMLLTLLVQVTVFICRKVGAGVSYRGGLGRPIAMKVTVSGTVGNDVLIIQEPNEVTWINDGYTVVDDETGQIYRVVARGLPSEDTIRLDRGWQGPLTPRGLWVVPPPIGGGRYPCIGVYQRIVRF